MDRFISIIVPTYNEEGNIRPLIERINRALDGRSYEILFIDDDSRDATAAVVEEMSRDHPVRVIVRRNERGLASAVVEGFNNARGELLAVIDADLQHPPEVLVDMLQAASDKNADLVIASRYVPGGSCGDWGLMRRIISKGAIFLAHLFLPPTRHINDPMSGFFMLDKSVISGARLNPTGYKILLEVMVAGHPGHSVEVPYSFHIREQGESKLTARQQLDYLKHLLSLMKRSGELTRFFKYCLVGGSGILVNEGMLWLLHEFTGLPLALSSAIAIELAIISNYTINNFFTFPDRSAPGVGAFFRRLAKFNTVSLVGLGINMGILLLFTNVFHFYYLLSNLVGIAVAMMWNYLVNLGWTWR